MSWIFLREKWYTWDMCTVTRKRYLVGTNRFGRLPQAPGPAGRRVLLKRTNLPVKRLSFNISQQDAALVLTTPRLRPRSSTNDLAPRLCTGLVSSRHTDAMLSAGEEPLCCGLSTTGAENGRPANIVASQGWGAYGIVTDLGGILT